MIEPSSSTTTDRIEIREMVLGPTTRTISKCLCSICSLLFLISGILVVLFLSLWIRDFENRLQVISSVVINGIFFVVFFVLSIYSFVSILCICISEENFIACNAPLYQFIKIHWPCKTVSRIVKYKPKERDTNSASTLPVEDVPEISTDPNSTVQVQVSECKTIQADVHQENMFNLKVPPISVDGKTRRPVSFPCVIAQDRAVSVLTPMPSYATGGVSKSAPGSLREFSPCILDYPIEEIGNQRTDLSGGHGSSNILIPVKATSITSISKDTIHDNSAKQKDNIKRQAPELLVQNPEETSRSMDNANDQLHNQEVDDDKAEILSTQKIAEKTEQISFSPVDNTVKISQDNVNVEAVLTHDLEQDSSVSVPHSSVLGSQREISEQLVEKEQVPQAILVDDATRSNEGTALKQGGTLSPEITMKEVNETENVEVSIETNSGEKVNSETTNF